MMVAQTRVLLQEVAMDFGGFPPLQYPASFVSSDVIIYDGQGRILVSTRVGSKYDGFTVVSFGGFMDPDDIDPKTAAVREAKEETGLDVRITSFVGVWGPHRFHHTLHEENGVLLARPTNEPEGPRPVVSFYFAGEVVGGTLVNTGEQQNHRWMHPRDLVGERISGDLALALVRFLNRTKEEARVGEQALSMIGLPSDFC